MSEFMNSLLTGCAELLAAADIGIWKPSGVYEADDTGIVLGTIPQQPDRIVALMTYGVADDPVFADSIVGLQVRCRWGGQDPRLVEDLADVIFSLLHSSTHVTLSTGVRVVQCQRQSGPVSLGQDQSQRWSNSSNYYLWVWRPAANRA
jgi:hypothetical protein